jgi:hypothetical protein
MSFNKVAKPPELTAAAISENPQVLVDAFDRIVGPYHNGGKAGVSVDAPKLLAWENQITAAVLQMSGKTLKKLYTSCCCAYDDATFKDKAKLRVVIFALQSSMTKHPLVSPYLGYGDMTTPVVCDSRIAHIVGGRGQNNYNPEQVLEIAADKENPKAPKSKPRP